MWGKVSSARMILLADVRNPEQLLAGDHRTQAARRQFLLFQAQVGEVWQVALDGLEPAVAREDAAHALVGELLNVEREHRQVLRGSGRGDGVEDGFGEVLAEVDAV